MAAAKKVPAKRPAVRKAPARKAPAAKKVPAKRPSGRARTAAARGATKADPPPPGGVAVAVGALIDSAKLVPGSWGDREAALAAVALTLAATLDAGAGLSTAAVARELRATIAALAPKEADGDDLAFIGDLSSPVGDSSES